MRQYDRMVIDAGGDDLLVLSGPAATPENVQAELARLHEQRRQRLAGASRQQRHLLTWWRSGHAVHARRELPDGLVVWLQAPPLADVLARERALGGGDDEVAWLAGWAEVGLVFGSFYSVTVPEGEHGSAHVVDLEPVTAATFRQARQAGWEL